MILGSLRQLFVKGVLLETKLPESVLSLARSFFCFMLSMSASLVKVCSFTYC
jgi:hypothetical protein